MASMLSEEFCSSLDSDPMDPVIPACCGKEPNSGPYSNLYFWPNVQHRPKETVLP